MIVGSVIYGVLAWLFNGVTFPNPPLSQVTFRPGAVLPVFFGFTFGPAVGFMVGAGGNLIADLFMGAVSPHWVLGHGLIGLFAGLPTLFKDKQQAWDLGALLAGIGGIVAAAFFFANSGARFTPSPTSEPTDFTFLMGLSVLLGCALAIAIRFMFVNRMAWALAVVWGAVGIVVGLGLAAAADIWLSNQTLFEAMVGRFIPAAGPSLLAVVVLVPLVMALHAAAQAGDA
jgi:hypothetical protein